MRAMKAPRASARPMFSELGVLRRGLSRMRTRESLRASSRRISTVRSSEAPSMKMNSIAPLKRCDSILAAASRMCSSSLRTGVRTLTSTDMAAER